MVEERLLVKPEAVYYDSARLKVLDDFYLEQMDKGVIRAASYCMAKEGQIFANKAFGTLTYDALDQNPLLPDSIHQIASVTKFITSAAVFKLVEDGKLRLSQPVSDFIEEFREAPFDRIGITHLLTHTSGLGIDPGALPVRGTNVYELIEQEFDSGGRNWIKAVLRSELAFEPGEQWGYSTIGFHILGEIIQRVSGEKLEDYITKNIFVPCDMTDTFYAPKLDQLDRIVINKEHQRERMEQYRKRLEYFSSSEDINPWKLIPPGGSGIYSTAKDLVKFGIMLQSGGVYHSKRVLSRKAIEKMTCTYTKQSVKDYCWNQPGMYRPYGLGPDKRCGDDFIYSDGTYGHEGAGRCNLLIDPVERFVICYFVPYIDEGVWNAVPVWNSLGIMWSGIL